MWSLGRRGVTSTPTALKTTKQEPSADSEATLISDDEAAESDLIDEAVAEINAIYSSTQLELALAIGEVVVKKFYGNDFKAVRDKNPNKHTSFRKLAARADKDGDLKVNKTALWRSVALYELCTRLELDVSGRKQLTMTHLRAVLPLPYKEQKRLVAYALEKDWNSTRMEQAADRAKKKHRKGKGGRKPLPGFVKVIHKVEKLAKSEQLFEDLDDERLEELEAEEAEQLYKAVTDMKLKCEKLQKKLKRVTPGFESLDRPALASPRSLTRG